jgi:hypothetical protein
LKIAPATTLVIGILAGSAAAPVAGQPTPEARYEVRFEATWSSGSHPGGFPDNGHFSPLVGGVHDDSVRFWRPGDLASRGIEEMAERGRTSPLDREIEDAIASGAAREVILGGPVPRSPGTVATTFGISLEHPLVTLVSMVAPSPDWFVGVRDLALLEDGDWVAERRVPLVGWDAGTDDGETFTSPDVEPSPHHPIAILDSGPFEGAVPLGAFVFRRLDTPPATPPTPLPLSAGRFQVEVTWLDYESRRGNGEPVPFADDGGWFWFFDPTNPEVTVKVLDGCGVNGHFWVFASGLTDVEVDLRITDTATGAVRTYRNELGQPFELVRDLEAFATCP